MRKNMDNYKSKIATVVLNFNGGELLFECIEAIKKKEDRFFKNIIVVDNKSTDGSVEKIRERFEDVEVIENRENLGYAGGNNVGIRYALKQGADFVFILNPDTLVVDKAIEKMLEVMKKDETIGIIGPKILQPDGKIWSVGGEIDKKRLTGGLIGLGEKDQGQYDQVKKVDYVSGTALFIRKEVFGKAGLFDEDFPYAAYEDLELGYRLQKKGLKILYNQRAIGYHYHKITMEDLNSRLIKVGKSAKILFRKHPELEGKVAFANLTTGQKIRQLIDPVLYFLNTPFGFRPVVDRYLATKVLSMYMKGFLGEI